jgi:hypothetical protein
LAWYSLIILLSLGGLALSLTSALIGWKLLRAKASSVAEPARLRVSSL